MTLDAAEQIVALLDKHGVTEIEAEGPGGRIHVRRSHVPVPSAPSLSDAPPPAADKEGASENEIPAVPDTWTLTAPMVGIFHHTRPPVSVGASVQATQKVGFIEAMKLMNDVPATEGGRVTEVLAEDGGPVEYGQPLLRLSRL